MLTKTHHSMYETTFRQAAENDIDGIMTIIRQAVSQMLREGKHQWDDTYPQRCHIADDIARGCGYVMTCGGRLAAYGAVVFSGEPAYNSIRGQWLSDGRYVVLHRLAVADGMKGQGVAERFMAEVEKMAAERGVHSFKVDTNHDNTRMQKVLNKLGFTYCGTVSYEKGDRMAYEKML